MDYNIIIDRINLCLNLFKQHLLKHHQNHFYINLDNNINYDNIMKYNNSLTPLMYDINNFDNFDINILQTKINDIESNSYPILSEHLYNDSINIYLNDLSNPIRIDTDSRILYLNNKLNTQLCSYYNQLQSEYNLDLADHNIDHIESYNTNTLYDNDYIFLIDYIDIKKIHEYYRLYHDSYKSWLTFKPNRNIVNKYLIVYINKN